MEILRIEDVVGDAAEVSVLTNRTGAVKAVVSIDFDPDEYGDCQTLMQYSPDAARKLAAALILAAEEVEAEEGDK